MIEALNFETAHLFGDTLPSLLKARYNEFILRQKYDVQSYNKMEYDQYDTPAAVYFAWKDRERLVKGGMRISPTNRPYMIREIWPNAISYIQTPVSQTVWELTRFFIDRRVEGVQNRRKAHGEILCALLEFALDHGITNYIGIAPPLLWDFTYARCGWPVHPIGDVLDIGFTENVRVCMLNISDEILEDVRTKMKIRNNVLPNIPVPIEESSSINENLYIGRNLYQSVDISTTYLGDK
jgi:acyl homoserine lactone synthase